MGGGSGERHGGREEFEGNKRKFIDKSFTHQIFASFASFWRWIFQKACKKNAPAPYHCMPFRRNKMPIGLFVFVKFGRMIWSFHIFS